MVTTKQRIQYALISLMDEHGTKGTELAEAIGVKKQSVSGWRRGETSPDLDNMIAVCNYYGITLDEFVGRGEDATNREEHELIERYRSMTAEQRAAILAMVKAMVG